MAGLGGEHPMIPPRPHSFDDCPEPHPAIEGPCVDIACCPSCWAPIGVLRPDGETFGWHIDNCSLPERHYGHCVGGGSGHPPSRVVRGHYPEMLRLDRGEHPMSTDPIREELSKHGPWISDHGGDICGCTGCQEWHGEGDGWVLEGDATSRFVLKPGAWSYQTHLVEAARPVIARQVVLKLHSEGFIEGGYVSAALSAVEAEDR